MMPGVGDQYYLKQSTGEDGASWLCDEKELTDKDVEWTMKFDSNQKFICPDIRLPIKYKCSYIEESPPEGGWPAGLGPPKTHPACIRDDKAGSYDNPLCQNADHQGCCPPITGPKEYYPGYPKELNTCDTHDDMTASGAPGCCFSYEEHHYEKECPKVITPPMGTPYIVKVKCDGCECRLKPKV